VAKQSKPDAGPGSLSFEESLAQIEAIIERIESGEVGLEQSLAEYERGVGLINLCRSKLDRARQQVEDLTRNLQAADEQSAPPADSSADEEGGPEDAEPRF